MTKNLKMILVLAAFAALCLAAAFSLLSRAQLAEEERFDWQSINNAIQVRGYEAAVSELEKRLAAHPKDALLHYYRARLYYETGKSAEALKEADEAIGLGYAQEISHALKGLIYGRLTGDFAKQRDLASKAITYDPTYDYPYLMRAEAAYQLGDPKACAADAASYRRMRPKDTDGYELELLCLERLGDYAGAETAGLRLLKIAPRSHSALWRLGRLYAAQGLHKRAVKKFTEAIQLSGGRPKYHLDRAASCAAEGDFSCEAMDYYAALDWQEVSGYASYYYLLGTALHRSGDLRPGLAAADNAVKMDPLNPANYALRGRLRADSGDRAGAGKDFRKMAELDPALSGETALLLARLKGR